MIVLSEHGCISDVFSLGEKIEPYFFPIKKIKLRYFVYVHVYAQYLFQIEVEGLIFLASL